MNNIVILMRYWRGTKNVNTEHKIIHTKKNAFALAPLHILMQKATTLSVG